MTEVRELPTPSARAASCADHTAGKMEPPLGSCWAKPNRNSGTFSKWSASHCDDFAMRAICWDSALSGSASIAARRPA